MGLRESLSHLVVVIIRLGSREMERKRNIQCNLQGSARGLGGGSKIDLQRVTLDTSRSQRHAGSRVQEGIFCSSFQAQSIELSGV